MQLKMFGMIHQSRWSWEHVSYTLNSLIFAQHECTKISSAQYRPFFAHLGAQKLIVCKFFKYHFRPEFDGILQYFWPP